MRPQTAYGRCQWPSSRESGGKNRTERDLKHAMQKTGDIIRESNDDTNLNRTVCHRQADGTVDREWERKDETAREKGVQKGKQNETTVNIGGGDWVYRVHHEHKRPPLIDSQRGGNHNAV